MHCCVTEWRPHHGIPGHLNSPQWTAWRLTALEGITLFACQNGHPVAPALPPIPSIIDKAKGLPSFKTQMVFHTSVPATSLSPQCIVFARALLLNNYLDGHPQMQLSLLYLTSLWYSGSVSSKLLSILMLISQQVPSPIISWGRGRRKRKGKGGSGGLCTRWNLSVPWEHHQKCNSSSF